MVLNTLIFMMIPSFIAPQCMDPEGMKECSFMSRDNLVSKDLLECINDCLVKRGKPCKFIQWIPQTKQCLVSSMNLFFQTVGDCATFRKTSCNNIIDDESLEVDSGNILFGGLQMEYVTRLEECKTICVISSTCQAYTWLAERRLCTIHDQSRQGTEHKLKQGDVQVMKKQFRRKGRCVVLNARGSSPIGRRDQNAQTLMKCVGNVLNTTRNNKVDWNYGRNECWFHDVKNLRKTYWHPVEHLIQLQKRAGCKMWRGSAHLKKLENKKMPGGLKINGLNREECVELCQLISNCAAVGWSSRYRECTFHHLELPVHEQLGNTLYTAGGGGITTSTTSTTSTTTVSTTTIPTSTEVMTTTSTGTFLGTFFVRRDKNLLTSKSLRRACLECALLCFQSNRTDFTSTILNDDGTCSISAPGTPGSSPKKLFEWIKL